MDGRYIRNFPALSQENWDKLRTKRIAVIGCGGLGGHIIELMARIGIGHITCVDGDVFDPSNLNRQLLSREDLIGCSKAQSAAERVAAINSDVSVRSVTAYFTKENAKSIIGDCDLVFDALDNIESRHILEEACEILNITYVHGAIAGWVAQAAVCLPGQRIARMLYPEGIVLKDKSVLSFTPALCASIQVSLGVNYLIGQDVKTGTLYCFDLLYQEYEKIPLT